MPTERETRQKITAAQKAACDDFKADVRSLTRNSAYMKMVGLVRVSRAETLDAMTDTDDLSRLPVLQGEAKAFKKILDLMLGSTKLSPNQVDYLTIEHKQIGPDLLDFQ